MKELIDLLKTIAPEFPLLIFFFIFTVMFLVYLEKKDKAFQKFLSDQRKEFTSILHEISDGFRKHDEKMTEAIVKMEERTSPKSRRTGCARTAMSSWSSTA